MWRIGGTNLVPSSYVVRKHSNLSSGGNALALSLNLRTTTLLFSKSSSNLFPTTINSQHFHQTPSYFEANQPIFNITPKKQTNHIIPNQRALNGELISIRIDRKHIHTEYANKKRRNYYISLILRYQQRRLKEMFTKTTLLVLLLLLILLAINYTITDKIRKDDENKGIAQMGIRRTLTDVIVGKMFRYFPTSVTRLFITILQTSESLFVERLITYLLLLRSLDIGESGSEDELKEEELRAVLPKIQKLDGELNFLIANLLLSVLKTQVISNEEEVEMENRNVESLRNEILNAICELAKNYPAIEDLYAPQIIMKNSHLFFFINNPIVLAIAEFAAQSQEMSKEIIERVGIDTIASISMSPIATPDFFYPLTRSLADLANGNEMIKEELVNKGVIKMLLKAVQCDHKQEVSSAVEAKKKSAFMLSPYNQHKKFSKEEVMTEVARCIGNLANTTDVEVSNSLIDSGCLTVLKIITQNLNADHAHLFTARAVANLTSFEKTKLRVAEEGWISILQHWIKTQCVRSITKEMTFTSSSGSNNHHLHSKAKTKKVEMTQQADPLLLSKCSIIAIANISTLNASFATETIRNLNLGDIIVTIQKYPNQTVIKEHFTRWLSILSSYQNVPLIINELIASVGVKGLAMLLRSYSSSSASSNRIVDHHNSSLEKSEFTKCNVIQTLGSLAMNKKIAEEILLLNKENWIENIEEMVNTSNPALIQRLSRLLANLSLNETTMKALQENVKLMKKMEEWMLSNDEATSHNAIRYFASLFSKELSHPKYADGFHLLYPSPMGGSISASSPSSLINDNDNKGEWRSEEEVDIIFVHGLQGDPFETWRTMPSTFETETECWPRDWLPKFFPRSRVLSIAYDSFMSKWVGDAMPLPQQAFFVLQKMKLAKVGDKPIIFIAHSFGGLLVKQMLKIASEDNVYRDILENTKGITFFATPHRGAELAALADSLFFRKTTVLDELDPKSTMLIHLNEQFQDFASHVPTLSFGENASTCIGSSLTCFQIVSDESANPNFEANEEVEHLFHKLDKNHFEVCKPNSITDISFQLVLSFILKCLNVKPNSN